MDFSSENQGFERNLVPLNDRLRSLSGFQPHVHVAKPLRRRRLRCSGTSRRSRIENSWRCLPVKSIRTHCITLTLSHFLLALDVEFVAILSRFCCCSSSLMQYKSGIPSVSGPLGTKRCALYNYWIVDEGQEYRLSVTQNRRELINETIRPAHH